LRAIQIQTEETLRHFQRLLVGIETVSPHLAFGRALNAMRINAEQSALEVAAGAPDLTQRHLQCLGLSDRMAAQQLMNGKISRDKGQPVSQLKALLS
jgi:hypothetical protein